MSLNAKQFADLILSTHSAPPKKSERRRLTRVPYSSPVIIVAGDSGSGGTPGLVKLRDISSGGISFLRGEPLSKGSSAVMRLPRPPGKTVSILYTICGSRMVSEGLFCIHAKFECVVSDDHEPEQHVVAPQQMDRIRDAILH